MPISSVAGALKALINGAAAAAQHRSRDTSRLVAAASMAAAALALLPHPAAAQCTTVGNTSQCAASGSAALNLIGTTAQTVTVLPSGNVHPVATAITVGDGSMVTNGGVIAGGNGQNAFGIATAGSNNVIVNTGQIVRTGLNANGTPSLSTGSLGISIGEANMPPQTGNAVFNTGTVNVAGINGAGVRVLNNTGTTIDNSGTISATGTFNGAAVTPHFPAGVLFEMGAGGSLINTGNIFSQNDAAVHVTAGAVGATIINSGTLSSASGTAVRFEGGNNAIQNAGLIQGDIVMSGGANQVTATGGEIIGAMLTQSGTSTVSLSNGALWNMTGDSKVTNLTVNGGFINFPTVPDNIVGQGFYHTLTVNSLNGGAGSEIRMNSFVGGLNSPSDKIVVTGMATTMNQSLVFNNTNPLAIGSGTASIRVVEADAPGATTAANAFVLDSEVRSGFISYMLARGMPGDPNSWFLVPNFVNGGTGTMAIGNVTGNVTGNTNGNANGVVVLPPNVLPAVPGNTFPPSSILPSIGPSVATYGTVQPVARVMGLSTLGTLRERMGDSFDETCCCTAVTTCCSQTDTRTPRGQGTGTATQTTLTQTTVTEGAVTSDGGCGSSNRPAVWGRVFGQTIDNRYQAFAAPLATGEMVGVEAGVDVWRGSLIPGHSDAAGLYFGYANADVDVSGLVTNLTNNGYMTARTGTVAFSGYSGGAYWTHTGPTGWYVDAVVQGTWYDGTASTQSSSLPLKGTGLVASLEGGYPIPIPIWWLGPRFAIEPQGQIIWQEVSFKDRDDGLGPVSLGSTAGYTGRLGLRGKWTLNAADGTVWQPYLQANIWRDWGGDADTLFGVGHVLLVEQATRLEFLGGVSARLNARWSVHAEGGYQFATDESGDNPYRRDGFKGSLGVRYAW